VSGSLLLLYGRHLQTISLALRRSLTKPSSAGDPSGKKEISLSDRSLGLASGTSSLPLEAARGRFRLLHPLESDQGLGDYSPPPQSAGLQAFQFTSETSRAGGLAAALLGISYSRTSWTGVARLYQRELTKAQREWVSNKVGCASFWRTNLLWGQVRSRSSAPYLFSTFQDISAGCGCLSDWRKRVGRCDFHRAPRGNRRRALHDFRLPQKPEGRAR
jgi:hypothetical protein